MIQFSENQIEFILAELDNVTREDIERFMADPDKNGEVYKTLVDDLMWIEVEETMKADSKGYYTPLSERGYTAEGIVTILSNYARENAMARRSAAKRE